MTSAAMTARSKRGALPLDRALKFALQIADALDRAHRAGVAHRHVKPANVILKRDGVRIPGHVNNHSGVM